MSGPDAYNPLLDPSTHSYTDGYPICAVCRQPKSAHTEWKPADPRMTPTIARAIEQRDAVVARRAIGNGEPVDVADEPDDRLDLAEAVYLACLAEKVSRAKANTIARAVLLRMRGRPPQGGVP